MASKTDIWNLALSHIGDGDDVDQEDEESTEAEQCRKFYPIARDLVLEEHHWGNCQKTTQLAELAEAASGQWTYRYSLPSDYIRAVTIAPDLDSLTTVWLTDEQFRQHVQLWENQFEIEAASDGSTTILTNEYQAYLKYTFRNENIASYPAGMVLAISWLLAHFIAGPLTKSPKMVAAMLQGYAMHMGKATTNDANASRSRPVHLPAHLRR